MLRVVPHEGVSREVATSRAQDVLRAHARASQLPGLTVERTGADTLTVTVQHAVDEAQVRQLRQNGPISVVDLTAVEPTTDPQALRAAGARLRNPSGRQRFVAFVTDPRGNRWLTPGEASSRTEAADYLRRTGDGTIVPIPAEWRVVQLWTPGNPQPRFTVTPRGTAVVANGNITDVKAVGSALKLSFSPEGARAFATFIADTGRGSPAPNRPLAAFVIPRREYLEVVGVATPRTLSRGAVFVTGGSAAAPALARRHAGGHLPGRLVEASTTTFGERPVLDGTPVDSLPAQIATPIRQAGVDVTAVRRVVSTSGYTVFAYRNRMEPWEPDSVYVARAGRLIDGATCGPAPGAPLVRPCGQGSTRPRVIVGRRAPGSTTVRGITRSGRSIPATVEGSWFILVNGTRDDPVARLDGFDRRGQRITTLEYPYGFTGPLW